MQIMNPFSVRTILEMSFDFIFASRDDFGSRPDLHPISDISQAVALSLSLSSFQKCIIIPANHLVSMYNTT